MGESVMRDKLMRFMQGRYGVDQFNNFLMKLFLTMPSFVNFFLVILRFYTEIRHIIVPYSASPSRYAAQAFGVSPPPNNRRTPPPAFMRRSTA